MIPPPGIPPGNERDKRREGAPFPIVGVGASAGGLEAFTELLKHLPLDTGMAFVLVQHLDPQHESALTQLLGRATSLPVQEATNNLRVQANRVYVIPRNTSLSIAEGMLKLEPRPKTPTPQRSIDFFFESLAQDRRERAIGVILSGTASDGTLGLEAIKAEGGITFAQDDSARYDSMPKSAVAAGCVDFVLSPKDIAREVVRIAKHPYVAGHAHDEDGATPLPSGGHGTLRSGTRQARIETARGRTKTTAADDGYKKVLQLLRNHSGVDFSLYKSATIQRRIARRMVLMKQNTLDGYQGFLRGNAKELNALYSDVLISVTSFFRNPEAFDILARKVFPRLLQERSDDPLRVWVLGCSTGQEAYSIAMAFVEAAEKASRTRRLQVFATDLNEALLDKARHGLYAKTLTHDVSPQRLRRFFVEEEGGYRIIKPLREMVVFARQNLVTDPPFSRMDLISCRNLLIYLEPALQKKALPTFHYALKPGGFLFLGGSESIGGFVDLFEPADKKHKIYEKKAAPTPAFHLPVRKDHGEPATGRRPPPLASSVRGEAANGSHAEISAQREADRVTVNQFAPPGVLVNGELQVVQFRGPTSVYLAPPTGKASFDVLKMAREGLMLPLRAAINKAKKDNKPARKENVRLQQDGKSKVINVEVIPLKNLHERAFLILFEEAGRAKRGIAAAPAPKPRKPHARLKSVRADQGQESRRSAELEAELAEMHDFLQSLQEQHEAANEELQAANEEVQSANEELQSLNEELETSKEELESTNEELTTVNEEMANRNAELNRLNSDLVNLQTSTKLAIVLLARDLTVRRFSAEAEKRLNLVASDVGRPIGDVRHRLVFAEAAATGKPTGSPSEPDLEGFISEVIDSVRGRDAEMRDREGRWYSLRVRPYLTPDNKVDGAVLVLVDIDELKRVEREAQAARDYAEATVRTARTPLLVLRADLRVNTANEAFYRTFKTVAEQTIGAVIFDLAGGAWNISKLRSLLEDVLPRNSFFNDFEVTHNFPHIGKRAMLLNARQLDQEDGSPQMILLAIEDVTERRRADDATSALAAIVDSSADAIIGKDVNGVITSWNHGAQDIFGYTAREAIGQSITMLIPPERLYEEPGILERVRRGERVEHFETVRVRKDGSRLDISLTVSPIKDAMGRVIGASKIARDITERKQAEEALREAARHKDEFLALLAHELRGPLAPLSHELEILKRAGDDADLVRQARATMERQLRQMTRLIDDLLDTARISQGKLELRRKHVELASVVHHAVETLQPALESARHELVVNLPQEPVYLNADSLRLAQVFGNLLNNASKFSEPGSRISLTAEEEGGEVMVAVKDAGVGIPLDMLQRIFDMFTQVDQSLERAHGGLGIGLTLVRQLVELHGGSVQAFSEGPGRGSEFVVRLPVLTEKSKFQSRDTTRSETLPATGHRILVVDDNRDAADSLARLLRMTGNETRIANDGLEAVDAAAMFKPDVVLLDIGLPKLNGYDACRRIREQPWGKHMAVIALTGWGQEEHRHKAKDAGFDGHLVKPVDVDALMRLLADPRPPSV